MFSATVMTNYKPAGASVSPRTLHCYCDPAAASCAAAHAASPAVKTIARALPAISHFSRAARHHLLAQLSDGGSRCSTSCRQTSSFGGPACVRACVCERARVRAHVCVVRLTGSSASCAASCCMTESCSPVASCLHRTHLNMQIVSYPSCLHLFYCCFYKFLIILFTVASLWKSSSGSRALVRKSTRRSTQTPTVGFTDPYD